MTQLPGICIELKNSIEQGEPERSKELSEKALEALDPVLIIKNCIIPAMSNVGEKFSRLEIFLPEVMMAAEAFEAAVKVIEPRITKDQKKELTLGRVVIATIQGDIHDLGKNMVAMMLRAAGFEVYDLGRDVPPDVILKKALEVNADIVAVSALMSTSLPYIKDLLKLLAEKGLRSRFIVMVGGGAVTREWAKEIGADGYGENFEEAVKVAVELISTRKAAEQKRV